VVEQRLPSSAELLRLLPPPRSSTASATTAHATTRVLVQYPVVRSHSEVTRCQSYWTHFTTLLNAEREVEETTNTQRLRQWSVQRLVREGYALTDLTVLTQHVVTASPPDSGLRLAVKFRIPSPAVSAPGTHATRLMPGDSVRLYPWTSATTTVQSAPTKESRGDSEHTPAHVSATVLERSAHWILISCPHSHALSDQLAVRELRWRLDYEANLTTYTRLLRALSAFVSPQVSATQPEVAVWQRLLVGAHTQPQEAERLAAVPSAVWTSATAQLPAVPLSATHLTSLVPEWMQWALNDSQRHVIVHALCRQLSLVQGPPGTGKTHTAVHLLKLCALLSQRVRGLKLRPMLVCAYTNIAVDNLMEGLLRVGGVDVVRLGRPVKVRPELSLHTLDYRVQHHPQYGALHALTERLHHRQLLPGESVASLQQRIRTLSTYIHTDILSHVDCVCATCVGAGEDLLASLSFPLLLIDEATQVPEPAVLIGLLHRVQQLIMFGDHFQLPPTVTSVKAQQGGLGMSLFARLAGAARLSPSACHSDTELVLPPTAVVKSSSPSPVLVCPFLLQYQYRMHPLLAHFVNWHFYRGAIRDAISTESRLLPPSFPWPQLHPQSAFVPLCHLETDIPLQSDCHCVLNQSSSRESSHNTSTQSSSLLQSFSDMSSLGECVAPVAFIHVASSEEPADHDGDVLPPTSDAQNSAVTKTYRNPAEAAAVIQALKILLTPVSTNGCQSLLTISDVGIITPYRGQLQLINELLHKDPYFQKFRPRRDSADTEQMSANANLFTFTLDEGEEAWTQHTVGVHVATVDGFQGREKEVILLSCVRANAWGDLGFLRDWRRLNVALSRAKRGLIVFGNKDTLLNDPHWRKWLQWVEVNHFTVNIEQLEYQSKRNE
jgi:hypothetical protein